MSTAPEVRPIETEYRGYRFRSRLEARWAVFFDQLGVRWEYEPQGFETPAGPYLPDFLLHDVNGERGVWFEVKPTNATSDDERWAHLVLGTERELIVAYGMSGPDQCDYRPDGDLVLIEAVLDNNGEVVAGEDGWREFCICPVCDRIGIQYQGAHGRVCWHDGWEADEYGPGSGHPRVLASYAAARSARFEHGESGPGVVLSQRRDPEPRRPLGPPPARLSSLLPGVVGQIAAAHGVHIPRKRG